MKRTIKLGVAFLLLCSMFLFSGCIKSNMRMGINKDRSMDFSFTYLLTNSIAEMDSGYGTSAVSGFDESSEAWQSLKKRGFTVGTYGEDDYTGFRATRHYASIDDLSQEGDLCVSMEGFTNDDFDDSVFFSVKRGFTQDVYTAHFVYNLVDTNDDSSDEAFDVSSFLASADISYTVVLPYAAISHNATSVSEDGLTYTWKTPYGEVTQINYSFSMPNNHIALYVCICSGFLLVLAVVVLLILRRKKHKAVERYYAYIPLPDIGEYGADKENLSDVSSGEEPTEDIGSDE